MTLYESVYYGRALRADSSSEAAQMFARREARKRFGRRADCRHVRLDSWSEDGTHHRYEAFIGTRGRQPGTWTGLNVWVSVYRKD